MALHREDIVDIDLNQNGNLHRSFLNHAVGKGDIMENVFGVRLTRNGEPVNVGGASCIGIFMAPNGQNILISGAEYTYCNGNVAWVQLPQACYNAEGNFTLAIKVIDNDVTGTMRIIDGTVDNTGADTAIAPTGNVPTYAEIIAVYEDMLAAKDGCIRFDVTQSLTDAQKERARTNAEAQKDIGFYIDAQGYLCQRISSDT